MKSDTYLASFDSHGFPCFPRFRPISDSLRFPLIPFDSLHPTVHPVRYAVWIEGGSSNISVDTCAVSDVSGGIRIGRGAPLPAPPSSSSSSSGAGRTHGITVRNSHITGGALVYREAAGVLSQNADRVTLYRNDISFFNHVGISMGWVWGASPVAGRSNAILSNHVHHVGNNDLSDLGGIYLLGSQPNTTVNGNIVHHSDPYFLYGHGIYLDEGSSNIDISQVLEYTCWGCNGWMSE